ncbi:glycosyltransferase [Chlorogloeopsis sp. ULAP02]|uniref:glycosyltransferase n=1 Tax=Chlorogloeopsis sp. ULAP02 TaxID=3107926 RepID=UPI00313587D0
MRIIIVTWGTSGDVIPFVALALGLKQAGHQVQLATLSEYQEFVSNYGVPCIPMDWNEYENPFHAILKFRPLHVISSQYNQLRSLKDGLLPELWRVCQEAEVIIFSPASYPSYYIAEKLGIPCYAACVQPYHQTDDFPNPYVTDGKFLGSLYNWLSYPLFDQLLWQFVRPTINRWRQETLNLSPLPFWSGIVRWMNQKKLPFIYGYSPSFLPKPSEWGDWIHITGYWFLEKHKDWQPSKELMEFLAAGSPPIYIGFGNKGGWDSIALTKLVLEALKITEQRGILLVGEDLSSQVDFPDDVFPIEWVPFDWLFPRIAAAVHHGGLGTVHAALRAGIPNIIVPYYDDNIFWARRIVELGLGPQSIKRDQLSAQRLAMAIKTVVSDKNMQIRAIEMSKKVHVENGVQQAVEILNQYLAFNS